MRGKRVWPSHVEGRGCGQAMRGKRVWPSHEREEDWPSHEREEDVAKP